MNVKVNQDLCISCGLCVSGCPKVFRWNKDDKSEVFGDDIVLNQHKDSIQEIADDCPVEAIEIQ